MELLGTLFPGIPNGGRDGHSQRSYSYDPLGTLSQQETHYAEEVLPTADNITWHTIFGNYSPRVQQAANPEPIGNVELVKPAFLSRPGWWRVGYGSSNDWNDLRREGIGYGVYSPHLEQNPIPAWKLVEPGSGFVLPATFLGQPLVGKASPPGT